MTSNNQPTAIPMMKSACLLYLAALLPLMAQHPDTPVFDQSRAGIQQQRQQIIQQALRLRDEVPAIDKAEIDRQLSDPRPEPIELPAPFRGTLSPEEIASHAHRSNLRVGYCYLCTRCDDWHLNLAGGYAIANNVIVTCDHVMVNQTEMRDSFFVVADHQGNVALAVAVLARSSAMDTAILKVGGAEFTPVPLNPDVMQGAPAFCFSYPLRQQGFFSHGIVNRFFWNDRYRGEAPDTLDALIHLRANFSTDWAPGSSGSAVLDQTGNVIGHVATIAGLSSGNRPATIITLRTGVPARSVQSLAHGLTKPEEIQRIARIGQQNQASDAVSENPDDPE